MYFIYQIFIIHNNITDMRIFIVIILIVIAFVIYNTKSNNEKFNEEIKEKIKEKQFECSDVEYVKWNRERRMFDSLTYDFNDVL